MIGSLIDESLTRATVGIMGRRNGQMTVEDIVNSGRRRYRIVSAGSTLSSVKGVVSDSRRYSKAVVENTVE